jgi:1-acyl-sn-glycerol-3-phosphate acyltransferase
MGLSYAVGWRAFRLLFATYFRWRVLHPERVPLHGPVILACNHASYLDPPLVGAGLPRHVSFLARETLFDTFLVGAFLRSWRVVPVDRDGGTGRGLREILGRLDQGGAILLFPEGTRSPDGQLQPVRAGVGLAIIKSTAPVVPVRVFGTFEAYGRQVGFPRPHPVVVKYGHPMPFAALRSESKSCSRTRQKEIYQHAADQIMLAISQLDAKQDDPTFCEPKE